MLLYVSWHHTHVDHLLLHVWMHALHLRHTHDRHTKLHGSDTRQIRLVHHAWQNLVGITLQSTGLLHLDHLLHVHEHLLLLVDVLLLHLKRHLLHF